MEDIVERKAEKVKRSTRWGMLSSPKIGYGYLSTRSEQEICLKKPLTTYHPLWLKHSSTQYQYEKANPVLMAMTP